MYLANLFLLLFLQIRPCPERQTPVRRQQRSRWSLGDRGLHGHHLGVQGDLISLHPPTYSFVIMMGLTPPPNQTPVIHVSSPLFSTFLFRPSPSSTRSTTASSAPTSTTRAPGTTAVATPAAAEEEEAAAEAPRNPVEADQGVARPRPRRPDCTGKRERGNDVSLRNALSPIDRIPLLSNKR